MTRKYQRIAVVAAMDKEVELLRSLLQGETAAIKAGRTAMLTGRMGGAEIAIAKSGRPDGAITDSVLYLRVLFS